VVASGGSKRQYGPYPHPHPLSAATLSAKASAERGKTLQEASGVSAAIGAMDVNFSHQLASPKSRNRVRKKCDRVNTIKSATPLQDPCSTSLSGHSPPDFVTFSAFTVFREFGGWGSENPFEVSILV